VETGTIIMRLKEKNAPPDQKGGGEHESFLLPEFKQVKRQRDNNNQH
jgi:hypothetical protein